ncbi:MAG: hypothetical protein R3E79_58540 [Caldilineaceae bacterium]
MKKASKQKKQQKRKKGQDKAPPSKTQQQTHITENNVDEQQAHPPVTGEVAPLDLTTTAGETAEVVGPEADVNSSPPLTLAAAAAEHKAALLARNQQRAQWNQQRKAGKMVGAHVPKRFNRGG